MLNESESRNLASEPREVETISHYDFEADVVIVGLGIAGACAAIEAVASLDDLYGGNGGYWEDRGYQWYAGI